MECQICAKDVDVARTSVIKKNNRKSMMKSEEIK